jgi:uncharacterized protein (TIGR02246 family)
MKKWKIVLAVALLCPLPLVAQEGGDDNSTSTSVVEGSEATATPNDATEETAVQAAIASYTAAFNKGDAAALAAHWSEDGRFITPSGQAIQGRKQLESDFAAYFQESKNAKLELNNTVVQILSPSVARETGSARVIVPGQEPSDTEYEAIHIRTSEGWKIDSLQEQLSASPPPSHFDKLQDLEWMIGQWVDADGDATIETTCRWTRNQNFIVRSFKVFVDEQVDFEGTQVIGWDPHAQTIRSWMFDSDGGFGVGRWSRDGNRWSVTALNVLPDGRRASATTMYDVIDANTVRFQAIGRQVDGELLPNIGPLEIARVNNQ